MENFNIKKYLAEGALTNEMARTADPKNTTKGVQAAVVEYIGGIADNIAEATGYNLVKTNTQYSDAVILYFEDPRGANFMSTTPMFKVEIDISVRSAG